MFKTGFPRGWSTMKKLIWLKRAVLSAASAILKTVSGLAPLLLGNALANPIHSLIQYGKCTQPGTPTPDAPVDIVCNNGAIKLRRPSGMPIAYQMVEWLKPAGSIPITGFKTKSTQEIETVFYREQRGASYLYSSDTATSGTTNTTAYLTAGAGNWRWDGKSYSISVSAGSKITSVQNEDGVWINGTQYGYYTDAGDFVSTNDLRLSSNENTTVRIYAMTIREGETVTLDLVPVQRVTDSAYGFYDKVSGNFYTNADATFEAGDPIPDPVEIDTDGTPEVLTVSGKNLFNKSTADANRIYGYFASPGRTWTYADAAFSIRIPCKPNTAYTARYNGSSTQAVLGFGSTANDDVPDGNHRTVTVTQGVRKSSPTINTPVTITTGANDKWLIVAYNAAEPQHTDMQDNLQVEQGSTPTAYEPYVAPQTANVPMLLGVGDYKDTAELVSGIKTGKVGIKVLTGDNTKDGSWGTSGGASNLYSLTIANSSTDNTFSPISTHFVGVLGSVGYASIQDGQFKHGSNANIYYFKDTSSEDVTAFKAKLSNQYAAGTPVIVLYPLATETTEQTTAQHLHTTEGTNIVDAASNVDPVELKAEYYATE